MFYKDVIVLNLFFCCQQQKNRFYGGDLEMRQFFEEKGGIFQLKMMVLLR